MVSTSNSLLVTLDSPDLDAQHVGAKAARLAAARAAGLPVLPGVVVPAHHAVEVLASSVHALRTSGSGAARLAAMGAPIPEPLGRALAEAAQALATRLVVRSSALMEEDAPWAGAFTSYLDVTPDEVAIAVRGVWASAFSRDVLERCDHSGVDPADLGVSVLLQPHLDAEAGGTATVTRDGQVQIVGVLGSPAGLMAGWDPGERVTCAPDGEAQGASRLPEDLVVAVADLARRVRAELGDDHVEWASAGGVVHLLQANRRGVSERSDLRLVHPAGAETLRQKPCVAVARALRAFPGPLGEEVVLPLAAAAPGLEAPAATAPADDPVAAVREAVELARQLVVQAWRLPPGRAAATVSRTLAGLRGTEAAAAVQRLAGLQAIDPSLARRVVELVTSAGARLALDGRLTYAADVWQCPSAELLKGRTDAAAAFSRRAAQARPDAWEPLVYGVVAAAGRHHRGTDAAPGTGAGRARVVTDPAVPPVVRPRDVLVAERPLPQLASLLWSAAGLVTRAGGPGAHLLEIARSLNVPAVTGCELGEVFAGPERAWLVALDGELGSVAVLEG